MVVWGWLACSFFTIITGCVMAEICSTYPTAGSVYAWAGQLTSPRWGPLSAYVCGWFNFLGNAAGDAAFAFGFANIIAGAWDIANIDAEGYEPLGLGAQVGIAILMCFVYTGMNLLRTDIQGYINTFAMFFQLVTTVVLFVAVASLGSGASGKAPDSFVWGTFYNDTGFSGPGMELYVGLLGLLMSLFSFAGYEAGAHTAEETVGASRAAPYGIIGTCVAVATCGLCYILSLLYAIPFAGVAITEGMADPASSEFVSEAAADYVGTDLGIFTVYIDGRTANPVTDIFLHVGGKAGALGLTALVLINLFFAGYASLTVTSRIAYAMARDGALPYSTWMARVWPSNKCPANSCYTVLLIDVLLLLLPLTTMGADNGPLAFSAVTGLTCIGFQISYAIPCWQRAVLGSAFPKAQVHMGRLSVPMAYVAAGFLTSTSFIFLFQTAFPASPENVNYVCVVVAGTALLAAGYWFAVGRHKYAGPLRAANDWYVAPPGGGAKGAPAAADAPPATVVAAEDPK